MKITILGTVILLFIYQIIICYNDVDRLKNWFWWILIKKLAPTPSLHWSSKAVIKMVFFLDYKTISIEFYLMKSLQICLLFCNKNPNNVNFIQVNLLDDRHINLPTLNLRANTRGPPSTVNTVFSRAIGKTFPEYHQKLFMADPGKKLIARYKFIKSFFLPLAARPETSPETWLSRVVTCHRSLKYTCMTLTVWFTTKWD